MLFDASRHEPLTGGPWDETRVRQAIRDIAADLAARFDARHFWPVHPLDLESGPPPETPEKGLYAGAAGTLWALHYLEQRGLSASSTDHVAWFRAVYDAYLASPDTGEVIPSWFLGEVGIGVATWRVAPSEALAGRLFQQIRSNIGNPTLEALWGAPGTMLGALYMLEWTGEPRWRDLFLENVDALWAEWKPDPALECHLWTQDLYGSIVKLLGAGHGLAGNVYPLLRGNGLLDAERRAALFHRCAEALRVTARLEDGCANWPPGTEPPRPGRPEMLVQWCHGAPGMVTGFCHFPPGVDPAVDRLLLAAGALIWEAGPLLKGPGLCHGTAGNGYAFLKLYRRTGEAVWLERARVFAMHAIAQSEQAMATYGIRRYSLWTGDPGLAVYLAHCITGEDDLPGWDIL